MYVNCSIETTISHCQNAPLNPIQIFTKGTLSGLMFQSGSGRIPEILRWIVENGGRDTKINFLDGEIRRVLSVESNMHPVTLQKIKEKIPKEVLALLKDQGWDATRIYDAVKEALIEGGELKRIPDPF